MTHDELRALVAPYAAGTLEAPFADAMRAHLAAGCESCLERVFDLPVGRLPRVAPAVATPPSVARPAAAPARPPATERRRTAGVLAVLTLVLGGCLAWTVRELRAREAAHRETLALVDAERAELALRMNDLQRRLRVAHARRPSPVDGAPHVGASDGLEHELLAAPGAQLLVLQPAAPFRDVRGHLLWKSGHDAAVLYAFALPELAVGIAYRVRLVLDDGRVIGGPTFLPGAGGNAAVAVRVGRESRLREAQVLLTGRPLTRVLVGRAT